MESKPLESSNSEKKSAPSKEERARRISMSLSSDDSAELEAVKINDSPSELAHFYKTFPEDTINSFNSLSAFAREVETSILPPEIVLIGLQGSGKSLLLEALLGHPISDLAPTTRPISITLINTSGQKNKAQYEEPRITIKRDAFLRDKFGEDVVVSIADLPSVLKTRLTPNVAATPIQIKYEWNYCASMTLIDTPGLTDFSNTDSDRTKIVQEYAKASNHRTLLFVENANEWDAVESIDFAKKFDVNLSRSTFVFTKFYQHLQLMSDQAEVTQFFSKIPGDAKCFFVSLFSKSTREKAISSKQFTLRILQAWQRDLNLLEKLKYNRRDECLIGVTSLRDSLLELTYRSWKDSIPELRKQLTTMKKTSSDIMKKLSDQLHLDHGKLRSMISNYVADWLQVVVHLIEGSVEGSAVAMGQTLDDEAFDEENSDWVNEEQQIIAVSQLNVAKANERLFGGEQFDRLLHVFQSIVHLPEMSEISYQEVSEGTAAGCKLTTANNLIDFTMVATQVVQKRLYRLYIPLIEQLTKRAVHTMKRLADIGFKILNANTKKMVNNNPNRSTSGFDGNGLSLMKGGFIYFQSTVRDLFWEYIDTIGKTFKQKCLDEVACTKLLMWELKNGKYSTPKESTVSIKLLHQLSSQLYEDARETILNNILLKAHNYFLDIFQRNVSGEMLKNISSFSDTFLDEMFDMKTTKELLKDELRKEEDVNQALSEKENLLRDIVGQFSRLKLVSASKLV